MSSKTSYERLLSAILEHKDMKNRLPEDFLKNNIKEFEDAINDDMNVPKAIGIMWNLVRNDIKSQDIYEVLIKMDQIFGLGFINAKQILEKSKGQNQNDLSSEIIELIDKRQEARKNKDWKLSDILREKLKNLGIVIEDTPDGVKITKKNNL
jgi:cysteinyl-tRNA synthetase